MAWLLLAYFAVVVVALLGVAWAFLGFVTAAHVLDLIAERHARLTARLDRARFDLINRGLTRELAFLVLVSRVSWASSPSFYAVAVFALAVPLARMANLTIVVLLQRQTEQPIQVRNVDLSGLRLPRQPPPFLVNRAVQRLHWLSLIALLIGSVAAGTNVAVAFVVAAVAVLAITMVWVAAVVHELVLLRGCLRGPALLSAVNERVQQLRPQVVLYFSGGVNSSMYVLHVNMWLATVDRLRSSALVLLREQANLPLLAGTSSPIVCIPRWADIARFRLPHLRLVLYVNNYAKENAEMLGIRGVKHVFIGHGDSDKPSSFSQSSKVFSEIWVAGPAGRDRYLRANIGIRAEDIVEVGRPQLDGILPVDPKMTDPLLTILYAPTWEGWANDPLHTSLVLAGPTLIQGLLEAHPPVRVIYKPHPATGLVSRTVVAAHERIAAMLATDNASREVTGGLELISGRSPPCSQDPWWASEPEWAHRVVSGAVPTLYDCFNHCDILVADISAVISDFLASQKPYVVVNMRGLNDEEFRQAFPSTGAAYLLNGRGEGLAAILQDVRDGDPMASRRRAQKAYLLGSDDGSAMTRFAEAVERVVRIAQETWPDQPTGGLNR